MYNAMLPLVCSLGLFLIKDDMALRVPLSRELVGYFHISVIVMWLHKIESLIGEEYKFAPTFFIGDDEIKERKLYICFIGTFLCMLTICALLLTGNPLRRVCLLVWSIQLVSESHHFFKPHNYPGKWTAGLLVVLGLVLMVNWLDSIEPMVKYRRYACLILGYFVLILIKNIIFQ
jgi:hypothetical protein